MRTAGQAGWELCLSAQACRRLPIKARTPHVVGSSSVTYNTLVNNNKNYKRGAVVVPAKRGAFMRAGSCIFLLIPRAGAARPVARFIVDACRSLLIPRFAAALALFVMLVAPAAARVERVEILAREPFANGAAFGPAGGYEKLRGRAFFALDPAAAANAAIADLKLAPRRADGRVVFTADFLLLRPTDPAHGNGTLLYEVNNRGRIA